MMTTLTNKMDDILLFGTDSTSAGIQLEKNLIEQSIFHIKQLLITNESY